ncbi:MAG: N-acetylmuramoyl-L-alanine amidase [Acidobacteria bacterium]|nr:MAG: N-acetylmuramoyl-L-alanine amidase [Acidobacteriota bacterium]
MRWAAALVWLALFAFPADANAHRSEAWAQTRFVSAGKMREALNGRPAKDRTRREYEKVIEAYRGIYYGAPISTKADPSVVAVAELMVEMGRLFGDNGILRSSIRQYQFLRREYPGSKYRFDALFTIGEIYKDDLGDAIRARSSFQEFLRRYPKHRLAEQARRELTEPVQNASLKSHEDKDKDSTAEDGDSAKGNSGKEDDGEEPISAEPTSVKLARVTGIRHWSTPDYTRVAIDLEQDIKFESQRINRPDRIFFDLLDTKLASTLVGKTFDVDDGLLKKIRIAQFQRGKTRVVLEVEDLSDYDAFLLPNPSRLIIDVHGNDVRRAAAGIKTKAEATSGAKNPSSKKTQIAAMKRCDTQDPSSSCAAGSDAGHDVSKQDTAGQSGEEESRTVQPIVVPSSAAPKKKVVEADDEDDSAASLNPPEMKPAAKAKSKTPAPSGSKNTRRASASEVDVHEAQPNAAGDRSLIRALGLKFGKIVIDPGHGGHDTGTIGPHRLLEKELVLEVSRRLGKMLETRLGAEVVYTRKDDTFIPLETRTAIANQEQADLFVSIHANASDDPDARGVETYYLNFTSSRDALEVAARENAVSEKSIHELQDLVKKIALKEKIEESREFASDVQRALHSGLAAKSPGIRDRGVRKAPFIVLIGANMPSILAEISFVSNPGDEHRLRTPEYRQRIAESLYRGISKYVSGLSGVKVASRIEKVTSQ